MKAWFGLAILVAALTMLSACAAPTPVPQPSIPQDSAAAPTDTREPARRGTRLAEPSPTNAQSATPTNARTETREPRAAETRSAESQPTNAPATIVAAPSTPADLRGIYVSSDALPQPKDKEAALAASLQVSGVDGLLLVLGWDAIEPGMGQYQWDTLDKWMSTAVSAGKQVDLSITAYNAPAWLFRASCR